MPETNSYKIAVWNANGLQQHARELKMFVNEQNIDIMMVSETHFTDKNYLKVPKYKIYHTNHPDDKAHGGTAIIIRDDIKHFEKEKFRKDYLQATSITIEEAHGPLTISAIYCPPKHNNKAEQFQEFFSTLGNRFIAGGDYNAKHLMWGSRIITSKGRELLKAIRKDNLQHISTGEPTYWPSDRNKKPDTIDFCITKNIDPKKCKAESCFDLSSDHSPIIVTISSKITIKDKPLSLCSNRTNWPSFRENLDQNISLNLPLQTEMDIEIAAINLTKNIQEAAYSATPNSETFPRKNTHISCTIQKKIAEKRKLRRNWQQQRTEENKRKFNRAIKELRDLIQIEQNQGIQEYLENLTSTEATDYSLWKATKKLRRSQQHNPPIKTSENNWARSNKEKADIFSKHLKNVFKPFQSQLHKDDENKITSFLDSPFQMDLPHEKLTVKKVKHTIMREINIKKAPGYDLITGKILKELSEKAIKLLTYIFNAMLRINYFPSIWKVAKILMILKPGKIPEDVTSYRPISLLPIISKVFEKLYIKKLNYIIEKRKIIPEHQFGFRNKHGTIEQVHRLVNQINADLNAKRYCSAAFLDISQAFDKVWHTGLQVKLKKLLPHPDYQLLKSYLTDRYFIVNQGDEHTELNPIYSGVPQGSVLGPVLYLLYTADLPTTKITTVATYADDTAILASHEDPVTASINLQTHLDQIQLWLKTWRIKANESKSTHITFTLRRRTCPPVNINHRQLPQAEHVKYLGMHLDRRLTWKKHILSKRKQLGLKLYQMYWLIGRKSI